MNGMPNTVNRVLGSKNANFSRSASPVERISEGAYSQQGLYISYTQQLQKKRSKVTRDLILEPYRSETQDQLYLLDESRLADGILDLILGRTS